jgi:hypothetical protein
MIQGVVDAAQSWMEESTMEEELWCMQPKHLNNNTQRWLDDLKPQQLSDNWHMLGESDWDNYLEGSLNLSNCENNQHM